jgi:hypothetical protein
LASVTTRGMENSSGGLKPDDLMIIDPAEKDAFYVLLLKTHMSAVFFRCVLLFLVTHECIHLTQTKF